MLQKILHQADFCVIGGGLAGMGAAITAARNGVKTILIHERPVFGGNASSEIRMWVCGCAKYLETGLIEEIRLENMAHNPQGSYPMWDAILFAKMMFQKNLTCLLNSSCIDATMEKNKIIKVKAYQQTTQQLHEVEAQFFADCSGDSILAPLSGAKFRHGREGSSEFDETLAPANGDKQTMGMSCILQAREMTKEQPFIRPDWVFSYPNEEAIPPRGHEMGKYQNFWWVELGGERDSINDTEKVRTELLQTLLGVWDHMKNYGDHGVKNYAIDWLGFLPGKRESRRYVGDYIMTEKDILSGNNFADAVAYGGWPIDDHHPHGICHRGEPNTNVKPPKPYTISLRSLYSCNIENLLFAGRNISVSHVALSSCRVMATCMLCGQAIGATVKVALNYGLSIRETAKKYAQEVQFLLLDNDCTIPGIRRKLNSRFDNVKLVLSDGVTSTMLRDGNDRDYECWQAVSGDTATYILEEKAVVREIRLVFDSNLARGENHGALSTHANYTLCDQSLNLPETLVKSFRILLDGKEFFRQENNYRRFYKIPVERKVQSVVLEILSSRNAPSGVFAFEIS